MTLTDIAGLIVAAVVLAIGVPWVIAGMDDE